MKKLLIIIVVLLLNFTIYAQEDKTVTLTVSGTGKTLEEAKTNALRSAIEQAFGAFISTKTEILNDNLVKDEIVSVANGNIEKFDIISQVEIPNNGYAMTLNATVSISKLTSFAQSKGVSIEIKGGLFAANIIQQELNEKAELKAVENILYTSNEILKKSFDYSIETKGSPTLNNGKYDIPLKISIKLNKNFYEYRKYFINSLNGLSMSESEIRNYEEIKKPIGQLIIRKDSINFQENMLVRDYYGKEVADIKNFDEKSEKILYRISNSPVLEINSIKNLKKFKIEEWYSSPIIMYKVKNSDLGYSKIYLRNESSLKLISLFLDNIKLVILNFEILNNFEKRNGNQLINNRQMKSGIVNDFKIVLLDVLKNINFGKESFLKDIFYNENFGYDNNYTGDTNYIHFTSRVLSHAVYNQKDYFPNLLSILPIIETSQTILLSFSKFKLNDIITTISFIDTKSLEEIKQLTEYKIKPKE